jgi:pyrroloquinoline quinone biosynthesis protein B
MYLGREVMGSEQVPVYLMPKMAHFIRNNGPWSQLVDLNNIVVMPLADKTSIIFDSFSITPFLVPHRDEFSETVGFLIQGNNKTALFIPDINKWSRWNKDIAEEIKKVDYALIDATFYGQGELPGRDMSKIPHPLVTETMTLLTRLPKVERNKVWFIHMNHTNPLLDTSSDETNFVESQGFNIARTGMRFPL